MPELSLPAGPWHQDISTGCLTCLTSQIFINYHANYRSASGPMNINNMDMVTLNFFNVKFGHSLTRKMVCGKYTYQSCSQSFPTNWQHLHVGSDRAFSWCWAPSQSHHAARLCPWIANRLVLIEQQEQPEHTQNTLELRCWLTYKYGDYTLSCTSILSTGTNWSISMALLTPGNHLDKCLRSRKWDKAVCWIYAIRKHNVLYR